MGASDLIDILVDIVFCCLLLDHILVAIVCLSPLPI